MNGKPRFWEFYKAYRSSKLKEDVFYIYNKNEGNLRAYNKLPLKRRKRYQKAAVLIPFLFVLTSLVLFLTLSLTNVILWTGILNDAFFLSLLLEYLFMFISYKRLYTVMNFEKYTETDWNDEKESLYKSNRQATGSNIYISLICVALVMLMLLSSSYTLNYLRYLAEGGPQKNVGTASISLNLPFNFTIKLNEDNTQIINDGGIDFAVVKRTDMPKLYKIYIETYNTPEKVKLYINGIETDYNNGKDAYISASNSFFWSKDYFQLSIYGNINLEAAIDGENTIELKSSCFDKKWTFTISLDNR